MSIESRSKKYGSALGQWQVEEVLGTGSGGKSMVFSLRHQDIGETMYSAMKVITLIEEQGTLNDLPPFRQQEYAAAEEEVRRQAAREVRLMEQLRGKTNVVDYLDHKFLRWQDSSSFGLDLLIRMEKLTDLRSQMRLGVRFSPEEIRQIGADICRALVLCHGKNILHRDIKPENIFFNQDKDYKLGDFGIARIMNDTPSNRASTSVGTAAYAPPEQNSGNYDHRVDIYSLGLVLYELANGNRLPFAATAYITERSIQARLSGAPLTPPGDIAQEDPALSEIILRACAFHPEDRFQSAQEMLLALEKNVYFPVAAACQNTLPLQQNSYVTQPAANIPVAGTPYATQPVTNIPAAGTPYATQPAAVIPRTPQSPGPNSAVKTEQTHTGTTRRKFPLLLLLPLMVLAVAAAVFLFVHRHSWVPATCLESQYCASCGETKGAPLGHSWLDATCSAPKTCEVCGVRSGHPLEHNWSSGSCTVESLCLNCGLSRGTTGQHSWSSATCTDPEICTVCGETQGYALGHDWAAATTAAPETCRRCGLTQGRSLGMPLTRCRVLQSSNDGSKQEDVAVGSWRDSFGTTHYEALRFWVAQLPNYANTEHIIYELNGDYTQLHITVAPWEYTVASGRTKLLFYADDVLICDSGWISMDTGPGSISTILDVSDVQTLRIDCVTDSAAHCYCILSATLYAQ